MTDMEQRLNGVPRPEEPENAGQLEESETTRILRRAFEHLRDFGLDVSVTDEDGHTEVKGPDEPKEEPPAPPTQP